MARVNSTEVKQIIDTDLSSTVINAFINAANITVTAILGDDTVITSDQLVEIEKWFTAHLIASGPERQAASEKDTDASIKYSGEFGKNLDSTTYGQTVKILDTTGKMASSVGKRKPSLFGVTSFD